MSMVEPLDFPDKVMNFSIAVEVDKTTLAEDALWEAKHYPLSPREHALDEALINSEIRENQERQCVIEITTVIRR